VQCTLENKEYKCVWIERFKVPLVLPNSVSIVGYNRSSIQSSPSGTILYPGSDVVHHIFASVVIRFTELSDPWRPPFPVLNNTIKSLSLYYSFIHPLTPSRPLPARFTNMQKKSWIEILHLAGLSIETEKRFPVEAFFNQIWLHFLMCWVPGNSCPRINGIWTKIIAMQLFFETNCRTFWLGLAVVILSCFQILFSLEYCGFLVQQMPCICVEFNKSFGINMTLLNI